jgi:hypothetical protein
MPATEPAPQRGQKRMLSCVKPAYSCGIKARGRD